MYRMHSRVAKVTPTPREMEQALRDVGCSNKMAKEILAKGYLDDLRDVDSIPEIPPAAPQRDVETKTPAKVKDRISDLLIRAEMAAPKIAA